MHNHTIDSFVDKLLSNNSLLKEIIDHLIGHGAGVYLVGGAVRDLILDYSVYDLDIEVHAMDLKTLSSILSMYGQIITRGKSFGILCITNLLVDWSLPRKDSKGRHPLVSIDPMMGIDQALRRRDLTMNAMAINLVSKELIDPFNGLVDIANKTLRTPDPILFIQDPLRFYRVLQFIGRFEMIPDQELSDLCATMSLEGIAPERITKEFDKLFCLSKHPSIAFLWLRDSNCLKNIFPALYSDATDDQNRFNNTLSALDSAAAFQKYSTAKERMIILYVSLCYWLKKDSINYYKQLHGPVNSIESIKHFLRPMSSDMSIIRTVCLLVHYQNIPIEFIIKSAPPSAYKLLAYRLKPYTTIEQLCKLAIIIAQSFSCDRSIGIIEQFKQKSIELGIYTCSEKPLITGQDLLGLIAPSKYLGEQLEKAYLLQINNNISNKQLLLTMLQIKK